jgi:hypothetical protein
MDEEEKRALVLELFAQDVQIGLDAAEGEKRQELVRFVEDMWDKYRVTLEELHCHRASIERNLSDLLKRLTYT